MATSSLSHRAGASSDAENSSVQDAANDNDIISVFSQGRRTHTNMATTVNAVSAMNSSLDSFKPNLVHRHAPGDYDVQFDVKYCGICEYSFFAEAQNIVKSPEQRQQPKSCLCFSGSTSYRVLQCSLVVALAAHEDSSRQHEHARYERETFRRRSPSIGTESWHGGPATSCRLLFALPRDSTTTLRYFCIPHTFHETITESFERISMSLHPSFDSSTEQLISRLLAAWIRSDNRPLRRALRQE